MRQNYLEFLRGKVGNEIMERVDYDAVSTKLEPYLKGFRVELKSNAHLIYLVVNSSFELWRPYKKIEIEMDVFNYSMFSSDEMDAIAKLVCQQTRNTSKMFFIRYSFYSRKAD